MMIELTTPDGEKVQVDPDTLTNRTAKPGGISEYKLASGLKLAVKESWGDIHKLKKEQTDKEFGQPHHGHGQGGDDQSL